MEDLKDNASFYAEGLFKLLGMQFAADGPKAPPFDSIFKTLGLQVDVLQWSEDVVLLEHIESRKAESAATLKEILQANSSTTKQLERLHGRFVWFNSYIFGRRINSAVRVVSKYSRSANNPTKLDEPLKTAFAQFVGGH